MLASCDSLFGASTAARSCRQYLFPADNFFADVSNMDVVVLTQSAQVLWNAGYWEVCLVSLTKDKKG